MGAWASWRSAYITRTSARGLLRADAPRTNAIPYLLCTIDDSACSAIVLPFCLSSQMLLWANDALSRILQVPPVNLDPGILPVGGRDCLWESHVEPRQGYLGKRAHLGAGDWGILGGNYRAPCGLNNCALARSYLKIRVDASNLRLACEDLRIQQSCGLALCCASILSCWATAVNLCCLRREYPAVVINALIGTWAAFPPYASWGVFAPGKPFSFLGTMVFKVHILNRYRGFVPKHHPRHRGLMRWSRMGR